MRSLTYLLETRQNGANLVNIACRYCGWISRRDADTLKRTGVVHCPECQALFSPDRAVRKADAEPPKH